MHIIKLIVKILVNSLFFYLNRKGRKEDNNEKKTRS